MAGAGFGAMITAGPLPTPVVAFGIRHLDCVAGVVVTASHNPPQDNGYKVYLGDGSQIVPPADGEIAARIAEVAKHASDATCRGRWSTPPSGRSWSTPTCERVAGLVPPDAPRELSTGSTPRCTGWAGRWSSRRWPPRASRPRAVVAEQAAPDPDFPTVAFPNPEEPGAIDLALARAEEVGADLVIANDPDADRCAVATVVDGAWRMLSGDELGALLGDDALRRGVRGTYACSIVSSSLLETMAARARPAVRVHADRVQVDRPGTGSGVRLRGGHRLLRRPRRGAGQGRHLRPDPGAGAGRRAEGGRVARWPAGWTRSRRATGCTRPTSCRSGSPTSH